MQKYKAPVLLQGMGGMGKSALLNHWVHKAYNADFIDIKYKSIIYIDCSNDIETGFLTDIVLLEELNLKYLVENNSSDKLECIIRALAQIKGLLLVLDNLPENDLAMKQCKSQLGKLSRLSCHIIATSRSAFYDSFKFIPITSLREDECVHLFLIHSDLSTTSAKVNVVEDVIEIVNLAGKHTLVIELLGKIADYNVYTTSELLVILQENKFSIEGDVGYYKNDNYIAEDINTALGKLFTIVKIDEQQQYILYHVALMGSQVITFELLIECLDKLDRKSMYALKNLVKSGWLQATTFNHEIEKISESQADSKYCRMHEVISHTVRTQFYEHYQDDSRYNFFRPAVENLEHYYTQFDVYNSDTSLSPQKYIDRACLPAISSYVSNSVCLTNQSNQLEYLVISLNNLAVFFLNHGMYTLGLNTLTNCINNIENGLGETHCYYANILGVLAVLYESTCDYEKALPLHQKALKIRKESLGELHPDYITSLNNLAEFYRITGKYEQALPLYRQTLESLKQVSGKNHPHYATTVNNLALLYSATGEYRKVLPLFKEALNIRRQVLGEIHPDYATSLDNLAGFYKDIGEYEEALSLCEQALEIRKKVLSETHPDYALSLNNLANIHRIKGNYKKALPLFEQSLNIRLQVLGENHIEYVLSLNNLASIYMDMGEYRKPLLLFNKAIKTLNHISNGVHPCTPSILNNLAEYYKLIGEYDKVLPLYKQAHEMIKDIKGTMSPEYSTSLINLASLYHKLGVIDYEQLVLLHKRELEIIKQRLGEKNPTYAISLNNLGSLYESNGDYARALPLSEQALNIIEEALGKLHPTTQILRENYLYSKLKLS